MRTQPVSMTKEQFCEIRDLLGFDNVQLGQELGYNCTQYQCKQIDNIIAGRSEIKLLLILALECLATRQRKLQAFRAILESGGTAKSGG